MREVELPDFSIITGVNGSGKTQFLEAIKKGHVSCSSEVISNDAIQYFNTKIMLDQVGAAGQTQAQSLEQKQRKQEGVKQMLGVIVRNRSQLKQWIINNKITGDERLSDIRWFASASGEDMRDCLLCCKHRENEMTNAQAISFSQILSHMRADMERAIFSMGRPYGDLVRHVREYAEKIGVSVVAFDESDFDSALPVMWSSRDGLNIRLAEWFAAYYLAWERNRMCRYFSETLGEEHDWVCDEQFRRFYGPEPWDVTSRVFALCGAPYVFERPKFAFGSGGEYAINIKCKDIYDSNISMQDLSTGEQLLLAVTLFLYRGMADRGLAKLPKLLLLDEIDSPLHPAFTKPLLSLLLDTIVNEFKVKVLMVTHSPTTVALAPEGSVFEMRRNPRQFVNVSRAQAVESLTSGFVTVLPSSRVVIVESKIDAETFSMYFRCVSARGSVGSRISLTFLSASMRDSSGGGGVEEVKKWVPKLSEAFQELGFFGLIDRDAGNSERDGIKVIKRHSIENYLFDPLTIAAFLINNGVFDLFGSCSMCNRNYHRISDISISEAQSLVDDVCAFLMKDELDQGERRVEVRYLRSDLKILVPAWVVDMEGHRLENLIKTKLNPLLASQKKQVFALPSDKYRNALDIQESLPDLISADFIDIFESIQGGK